SILNSVNRSTRDAITLGIGLGSSRKAHGNLIWRLVWWMRCGLFLSLLRNLSRPDRRYLLLQCHLRLRYLILILLVTQRHIMCCRKINSYSTLPSIAFLTLTEKIRLRLFVLSNWPFRTASKKLTYCSRP